MSLEMGGTALLGRRALCGRAGVVGSAVYAPPVSPATVSRDPQGGLARGLDRRQLTPNLDYHSTFITRRATGLLPYHCPCTRLKLQAPLAIGLSRC